MNTDLMDTTRRYGRTTREVFKDERAEWFEPPIKAAKADKAVAVTLWLAALLVFVILTLEHLK